MKYGFVYIWFDKKKKKFYIGSHWGTENDGYICSSRLMHYAKRKRPSDFKRRILKRIYTAREDLLVEEYKWLSLIPDAQLGKKYYNLTKHQPGHWAATDKIKTVAQKLSDTYKIKHQDPEYKKIYLKGRNKLKGKKQSAKVVEKRRIAILNGKKSDLEHKKEVSNKMKLIWEQRNSGLLKKPKHKSLIKCQYCSFQSNGGNVAKHIKRYHINDKSSME